MKYVIFFLNIILIFFFNKIKKQFNATFKSAYNLTITNSTLGYVETSSHFLRKNKNSFFQFSCDQSGHIDLTLDFSTDDNITIQNNVFAVLDNITGNLNLDLYSVGKCSNLTGKYFLYI